MIVYHGTGADRLPGLLSSRPIRSPRIYLNGRRAFSTTTDVEIARLFALRRSPPSILHGNESEAGVVLEYELTGRAGRDWCRARESGVLQDEAEVAVLRDGVLRLRAIWRLHGGRWVRRRKAS